MSSKLIWSLLVLTLTVSLESAQCRQSISPSRGPSSVTPAATVTTGTPLSEGGLNKRPFNVSSESAWHWENKTSAKELVLGPNTTVSGILIVFSGHFFKLLYFLDEKTTWQCSGSIFSKRTIYCETALNYI